VASDDSILIDNGREFQNLGPTISKARSPRCFSLDRHTESNLDYI